MVRRKVLEKAVSTAIWFDSEEDEAGDWSSSNTRSRARRPACESSSPQKKLCHLLQWSLKAQHNDPAQRGRVVGQAQGIGQSQEIV